MSTADPDFHAPEIIRDPFPALAEMRRAAPVLWNESLKGWCVTRHADICAALKEPRLSAERIQPFLEQQSRISRDIVESLGAVFLLWLPFLDPPRHTRLRKLLSAGFSGRAIAALPARITEIVDGLIAAMPAGGRLDVIGDFAAPLPGIVIADILGVPRRDVGRLKRWSDDIAAFVLDSRLRDDKYRVAARATDEMRAYFDRLIAERQQHPGNAVIDDLIAAHEGDDRLSRAELLSSCVLLLFAGHETTTQMFGNGLLALLRHPEQMETLARAGAGSALMEGALEEILRYDGPTVATVRVVREPFTLHGVRLERGARVHLMIGAANRDPAVFEAPERFDIRRENARRQISFGFGPHVCLGARLARMEGVLGFPPLARALAGARLPDAPLEWSDSLIVRGLRALPLRLQNGQGESKPRRAPSSG